MRISVATLVVIKISHNCESYDSPVINGQVAALQQVDAGLIGLDDAEGLDKILPELASLQVLKGYSDDGVALLERASANITLRMLLNHSSGMSSHLYMYPKRT
jgi:CubicO group peptidase (beta-lactamase class C family)